MNLANNQRVCVVIAHPLSIDLQSRITHLGSPVPYSMDVIYASDLLRQEYMLARDKGADAVLAEGAALKEELDAMLARAEVVFVPALSNPNLMARFSEAAAPKLRWVQVTTVGVDQLRRSGVLDRPVVVTTGQGLRSRSIAEHVIWAMLTLSRDSLRRLHDQAQRLWNPRGRPMRLLSGQTLGIVGLGSIGGVTAQLGKALGMRVVATRRSAVKGEQNANGGDEMFPRADLLEMLGQSDFVLLSTPLTPETRRMIGEKELRAMKQTACIINISRGDLLDQDALVRALKEEWIGGAVLDVSTPEPLPAESELWTLPQVIITPHISATAGDLGDTNEAAVELFCQNLERYLAGTPLVNVYDRERGY